MAYDEQLAERVRQVLSDHAGLTERKMFGGIGFMLQGNMAVGVQGTDLLLRLSESDASAALKKPHVRIMDFTGKPMKNYVYVAAAGCKSAPQLQAWIAKAVAFNATLPPK